jgi:hypothetical protein
MAPSGTIIVLALASLLAPAPYGLPRLVDAPRILKVAENVPSLPQPRPRHGEPEADDGAATAATVSLSRSRPGPSGRSADTEEAGLPRLAASEHATCMRSLEATGIAAEVLPAIREEPCGMRWPLQLAAIGQGEEVIDLTPPAKVRCPIADALARWMEMAVQPAAEEHLGGRVTGLRVSGSYVCRSRNHVAGARLSEHAVGNAIDIAAFKIEGEDWVVVGPSEDQVPRHAMFLAEVREAACAHFHTVLGPGTDAYHTDHFHLDLARRGISGTRRYCR